MNVSEIMNNEGYSVESIPSAVLSFDTGECKSICEIPNSLNKLFDGVEIYCEDCSKVIIINTEYTGEDDEFLPLYVEYYDGENYLMVEIAYDENLQVVYVNDLK